MPRHTLIITAIIVAVILIGATAFSIFLRQGGKEVRRGEEVAVTPKEPVVQPEEPTTAETIDTSDWKTYRNEEYGFEFKYPPHLQIGKTLFDQPFNPILEGSIIATFSDGKINELVIVASERPLEGYIVWDNPRGLAYCLQTDLFQPENHWVSFVPGQITTIKRKSTGKEPKLLDLPITAYGYRSGDDKCLWEGAVVPHPRYNWVFHFLFMSCLDEGQKPGPLGHPPSLTPILATFQEIVTPEVIDTSDQRIYRNEKWGWGIKYNPKKWELYTSCSIDFPGQLIPDVKFYYYQEEKKPHPALSGETESFIPTLMIRVFKPSSSSLEFVKGKKTVGTKYVSGNPYPVYEANEVQRHNYTYYPVPWHFIFISHKEVVLEVSWDKYAEEFINPLLKGMFLF